MSFNFKLLILSAFIFPPTSFSLQFDIFQEDSSDIQPADIEKCENAAIALAAGSNNGTSTDNIDASYQGCDAQFRAQVSSYLLKTSD